LLGHGFRKSAVRTSLLLAVLGLSPGFARAQQLQQLTIPLLTMRVDRTRAAVGEPFRLTIHAHMRESLTHFDNLMLPSLPDFETVSHETHFEPADGGTDFTEVLTLVAKRAGDFAIPPVSIDAVNGQTLRPSRFTATDQIVVHVGPADGSRASPAQISARYASIAVISLLIAFLAFRIGGALFNWMVDLLRTMRARPLASPPARERPALPSGSETPLQRLRLAVTALRHDPSKASAEEARSALRRVLGASEEETMSDIIRRLSLSDRDLVGQALRAAERAAFIDANFRRSAIDEALPILEEACRQLERAY
jgi:hypothetical protein